MPPPCCPVSVLLSLGALDAGRLADRAAESSMSSPLAAAGLGAKDRSEASADSGGSEPSVAWPAQEERTSERGDGWAASPCALIS